MPAAVRFPGALTLSRALRLALVALLFAFPLSMAVAASQPATPVTGGETRLYVSHAGRFTAEIPASWTPDYRLANDLSGPGGFIGSFSISWWDPSITTLEGACEFATIDSQLDGDPVLEMTTWRDLPACIIRSYSETDSSPVALVFAHPDPVAGAGDEFVGVTTSAAHFDAITRSISFDPATVTAEAYLDSAIDIIETQSIVRDRIDWAAVRREAREQLGEDPEAGDYSQAHRALLLVMALIKMAGGDAHNYVIDPAAASGPSVPVPYVGPTGGISIDGVGYVAIPAFQGDAAQAEQFTDEMLALVDEEAEDASCGWIVDLRGNHGGNMYPMIYGLAPLLQPGTVVGFRNVIAREIEVAFEPDGSFTYDGLPITWQANGTMPSDPVLSHQPLAVLISFNTASSGEATALALASRDQTRFFGDGTADMATAPAWFPLYDGTIVSVATDWMVGPNGAIYPNGISPDVSVRVLPTQSLEDDPVVVAAMDWLNQHPSCDDEVRPAPAA